MICKVCQVEDETVGSYSVVGDGNKIVSMSVCEYCRKYYKDPETQSVPSQKQTEHTSGRPDGWPSYAKWPVNAGDALPPGWIWDSSGLHKS